MQLGGQTRNVGKSLEKDLFYCHGGVHAPSFSVELILVEII